jgi:hypothetical protein
MQLESRFCEFGSELLIISRTVQPFHFLSFSMLSLSFLCFDTSSLVPNSLGSVRHYNKSNSRGPKAEAPDISHSNDIIFLKQRFM